MARNLKNQRDRLQRAQNDKCFWCDRLCGISKNYLLRSTIDHVVPKCAGGGNEFANLVMACHVCNYKRTLKIAHKLKTVRLKLKEERKLYKQDIRYKIDTFNIQLTFPIYYD
jgi:5-methylcytosine-specific restriction endonuclease McrA